MDSALQTAFRESPLFAGLVPEARVLRFEDGESLSARADAEDSVGLVLRGLADVWCVASDGTGTLLNTVRQPDCFGIAYIYGGADMQTRVIARGRCDAAFVSRGAVRDLLAGDAEFAVRYHAMCNRKLQFLLGRISLLTAQSCRTRLAAYLLLNRGTDSFIRLHSSKDELASRLSVSRAAVYRELSRLQAMGLIQVTRQGVSLKDAEALERQLYDERNEGAQPAPANNRSEKL